MDYTALPLCLVILFSAVLGASEGKKEARRQVLPMFQSHELWGMSLVKLQTSRGPAVFILDSGSNVTTFDQPGDLVLYLGREKIEVRAFKNHPQIHEATDVAPEIRGVLGQDVLRRFSRVTLDFSTGEVVLER